MFRASLIATLWAAPALAQVDAAELQRLRDVAQIAALERMAIAAKAGEEPEDDLPLALARVTAADPALGARLQADSGAAAAEAAALLAAGASGDARQLTAGVIAALLLPEGGVAEAYEEAAEGEMDDYALAHLGLIRVGELLATLPPEPAADASLARLMAAIPAEPLDYAARLPGGEIEFETQALVMAAQSATGAQPWPRDDLARAAQVVRALVADGCADPDPARGRETLAIARFYHQDGLTPMLGLLAADAEATADHAYDGMAKAGAVSATDCAALQQALAQASAVVTGG